MRFKNFALVLAAVMLCVSSLAAQSSRQPWTTSQPNMTNSNTLTGSTVSPVPVMLGATRNGPGTPANFFSRSMSYTRVYNSLANCSAIFTAGPI